MAMESIGIYATPEMKSVLEKNYRKIYYANGFDTRAWDQKVEASPLYPYLKRIMVEHLKKVMENRTPQEVLGWFNYDRARKEEYV
jgi:cobalamin biosynthesis Co2+ chelatase CbiK